MGISLSSCAGFWCD